MEHESTLLETLDQAINLTKQAKNDTAFPLVFEEWGSVTKVGSGVAFVKGLPSLQSGELVNFSGKGYGLALNLEEESVGVILLDQAENISVGMEAQRTHQVMEVPVGHSLLGRLLDPLGRPLDERDPPLAEKKSPVERKAPSILDREPVTRPLQTGILAIDAVIPIGRGQRELILGDRQTGKTAIAIDTIINQRDQNVICIYCAIGKESSEMKRVIQDLETHQALEYSVLISASGKEAPGLNFIAPYSAMTMAEYFMEAGEDVLVIFDDLTRHAWSYRELSLLLRRPPTREAYPGDIFFVHSRLLERATQLNKEKGGGSITALPIIETEEQNISAYIPTNLISITDGQIYLSPKLYQEGVLPPIDIGKSVSRVGGKTQPPITRRLARDLRLLYTQYEELESFSRFGTRLDDETHSKLERGRRVREILKQNRLKPLALADQIIFLHALNKGTLDSISPKDIQGAKKKLQNKLRKEIPEVIEDINRGKELTDEDWETFDKAITR